MTAVLVTGGSGFLGRHLVPLLVARGDDVVATARSSTAASTLERLGAKPIFCDFDEAATVDDAFRGSAADVLVNLVSLGAGYTPAIVAAAADASIIRGVFVSSTAIFTTIDAPSKPRRLGGERVVTESALDWTVVRPTMIYGAPGDRNLERLLRIMGKLPVLPVPGGGERLQQPVHVDDLAAAIVNALRPVAVHQCYDLAGPEPLTFRSLLEQVGDAVGHRPKLVAVPLDSTIGAMRLYERLAPTPRLKAEQLERLSEDKAFAIDDARRDLGFDPRSFAAGIAEEADALGLRSSSSSVDRGAGEATAASQEHFDEVADGWIRRYEERPSFRNRLSVVGQVVSGVVRTAGEDRPTSVLDFGGGPGVFSAVASIDAERVVCLDPSAAMIEAGERNVDRVATLLRDHGEVHPDRIERVVGASSSLDGETFDVVLAIAVLEYLDDPAAAIVDLSERLRDRGAMVFTVPNDRSLFRRAEDVMGSFGAAAGGLMRSERLRSRAYASTRPHGNRIDWQSAAHEAGLVIDRVLPLRLSDTGVLGQVTATTIVVLRRP